MKFITLTPSPRKKSFKSTTS